MKGTKAFLLAVAVPLMFSAFDGGAAPVQKRESVRRQQSTTTQSNVRKTDTAARNTTLRTNNAAKERVNARNTSTVSTTRQSRSTVQRPHAQPTQTARTATQPVRQAVQSRASVPSNTRTSSTKITSRATRAGTLARNASTAAAAVMARDYSKCRTVFNECMDEFCANKDTQLKRCACSARHKEFSGTKQNLEKIEEKLLDFSQRLLVVNLDKEDALAINTATEGENAYNTKDSSESKKLLDEITKKLNTSFDDSNFDQNLNAISLSLNMDSAFDNIDSLGGASTTTKIGTALYSAALPVCREMAAEVCTEDELKIAESSYQLVIEQDCNTVSKTYQTQVDQARSKVMESGALLDMSRLDIHQKRNSDDMLTCKAKMLDMLTNSAVCGEDLHKCLDTTGHYINPTTGQAFLTTDLYLLQETIQRPTGDLTWQTVPNNSSFVNFLNTKKEYLEPAMENCQNIADAVWDGFLDDALAKIKLAQNAKLEEVRQSCTTLLSECIDESNQTIADFDARALSVFGIAADMTANEMCADVKTSCSNLIDNIDDTITGGWGDGVTGIMAANTYEAIMQTCRTVGENCIVQACQSITGKFDLCLGSESINRGAVIKRKVCWDDVMDCVASAGNKTLIEVQKQHPIDDKNTFYEEIYGNSPAQIYDFCTEECGDDNTSLDCYKCRLTESIWGNCEQQPTVEDDKNNILVPANNETGTLMAWLAKSTNYTSCYTYTTACSEWFGVSDGITNCCDTTLISAKFKTYNNQQTEIKICCDTGNTVKTTNTPKNDRFSYPQVYLEAPTALSHSSSMCAPVGVSGNANLLYSTKTDSGSNRQTVSTVYCLGELTADEADGTKINCSGQLIKIVQTNKLLRFYELQAPGSFKPLNMAYTDSTNKICNFNSTGLTIYSWKTVNGEVCSVKDPTGYHLYYDKGQL